MAEGLTEEEQSLFAEEGASLFGEDDAGESGVPTEEISSTFGCVCFTAVLPCASRGNRGRKGHQYITISQFKTKSKYQMYCVACGQKFALMNFSPGQACAWEMMTGL